MISEAKHTPEPWTGEPGTFWVCDVGNNIGDPGIWSEAIPADGTPFPYGDKQADRDRIVACVNACAGIPTEQLEAGCVEKLTNEALSLAFALTGGGHPCDVSDYHLDQMADTFGGHVADAYQNLCTALAPFQKEPNQ